MPTKNKTVETKASVEAWLKKIKDEKRRKDCADVIALFKKETGLEAKMWGTAIVGFGSYHYKYESGREGDAPLTGIANRANGIVLYLGKEFEKRAELLKDFGKYKEGGGCIYIKSMEGINKTVLSKMIKNSLKHKKKTYAC
jgi:hypothetical protein